MPDDDAVTQPPGDRPTGQPRPLDEAPSQRYVRAARPGAEPGPDSRESLGRPGPTQAALIGGVVALFHVAVLMVLAVVFTFTAGLVVVAVFLGRLTAVGVMAGDGGRSTPGLRRALAVGLSLGAVALAQVLLWLWAGVEGGSLGLVDYLVETYGPLIPLQFLLAGGAAWLSAK
jgi:hypothetical protein